MIGRLKHRLPDLVGPVLNRVIFWSAALLVLAVAGFAVYYYLDQRDGGTGGSSTGREIPGLEQAVRTNPDDASARTALAEAYLSDGRYAEAAQQYEVSLTLGDEQSPSALVGLGRAQLGTGDHAAARESFQKVVDMTAEEGVIPADLAETAHYYLGSIFLIEKQPNDAAIQLEKAVAIERMDADAWHLLGAAYLEAGDLDKAIDALAQAVLFVPNFTEAYEKMAVAYDRKGLSAESRYARGMVAYSQSRLDNAVEDLEAAIQGAPAFADAHFGLGLVRESRSERELAVASYQRALELEPDHFGAGAGLARLGGPSEGVTP